MSRILSRVLHAITSVYKVNQKSSADIFPPLVRQYRPTRCLIFPDIKTFFLWIIMQKKLD